MRRVCLAALVAAATATAAYAQDPQGAPPAGAETGVVSYPADYFTAQRPNSAMDMIDRIPGFSFDGGDQVRGFAGAAGNVLIDGQRPSSKNDNLEQILRRIPASQVERIDIIRGGAPGIDMQGKAVVANVIRKSGSGMSGLLANANLFNDDGEVNVQVRAEGAWRGDGRVLEGSLLWAEYTDDGAGDGPRVVRDAAGVPIQKSYMDTDGGGVQTVVVGGYETPLWGGKFRANVSGLDDHYDATYIDRPESGPAVREFEQDAQDRLQGELGLRYSRDLNARLSVELFGLQSHKTNDFVARFTSGPDSVRFAESDTSGESIARGVLRWKQSDALTWEGGGEVAFNWLESETEFSQNGVPVALPAANVRVEEQRGEGFVQGTWKPMPSLTLEGGVRIESSTISSSGDVVLEKTLVFPKPRLSAAWSPTSKDQFRFRIEREVGQLNFRDFVATSSLNGSGVQAGNPNLEPQQAWVVEATWERKLPWEITAVATVRHSALTDVIDRAPIFDPSGTFDSPANIGDGTQDDLLLNLNVPLGRFGIKGGLLKFDGHWRFSEVTDPTTGEQRRISGQHPFDGTINFSQDLPRWRLNWGVNVYTTWRERYYRFNEIDTYDLGSFVQFFAEYKPKPDLSFRIELENLGQRPFTQTRRVFTGPRSTDPVDFVDRRDLTFGTEIYLRVRKTWG